jgi:hypothetical protein
MYRSMSSHDGGIYDRGPTFGYTVDSLPPGHKAKIVNPSGPKRNDCQILHTKDGVQGDWTGSYKSAEEALAVLREEYYGVTV